MQTSRDSSPQTPDDLLTDLRTLVAEAEKMAGDSLAEHGADAIGALRTRFDAAHHRLNELCANARHKIVAGARCTDETIRANPYQSLAIAVGVGLLAGVIIGRRTR